MNQIRAFIAFHIVTKCPDTLFLSGWVDWLVPYAGEWAYGAAPAQGTEAVK